MIELRYVERDGLRILQQRRSTLVIELHIWAFWKKDRIEVVHTPWVDVPLVKGEDDAA
jgi:hypothetical protein